MTGYLDAYGAAETERAKREKLFKRLAIALVVIAVLGTAGWFLFRNYKEEARIRQFVQLLQSKQYGAAYAMWGCSEATPCRDYSMQRFLEDWGPQSKHPEPAAIQLTTSSTPSACSAAPTDCPASPGATGTKTCANGPRRFTSELKAEL